jgi:hypothetical protein
MRSTPPLAGSAKPGSSGQASTPSSPPLGRLEALAMAAAEFSLLDQVQRRAEQLRGNPQLARRLRNSLLSSRSRDGG